MKKQYLYDLSGRLLIKYPNEMDNEIYNDPIELIKIQDAALAAAEKRIDELEECQADKESNTRLVEELTKERDVLREAAIMAHRVLLQMNDHEDYTIRTINDLAAAIAQAALKEAENAKI